MLSVSECRKLVDDGEEYSDKETEEIRNTLYELANVAFDSWLEKRKRDHPYEKKTGITKIRGRVYAS